MRGGNLVPHQRKKTLDHPPSHSPDSKQRKGMPHINQPCYLTLSLSHT